MSNYNCAKGKQLLNSETKNSECISFLSRFFRRQQSRCCIAKTKVGFRDCRHLSKKNIRLRNVLYSRELITWHVDVLGKLENIFQRPYRQGKSETENILRVIFDKRLLFAGSNLSTLVTKDVNGQKTQREHV